MARRLNVAVAATAAMALVLTGCSSPSDNTGGNTNTDTGKIDKQANAIDASAKGPAEEIAGAKKGGTITVTAQATPNTFDPTDIYYVDSNEIGKLPFRTPTQFDIRDGVPTLVPDLTDLGTVSADKLSWTFKMQPGIKYEDGTEVKVEDLAYAIKRSFAHDVYVNGPTYQQQYFKDGDTYKGPYAGGDTYAVGAFPVEKVVDTTGAGDQYAAGFMFGLATGRPLNVCGQLGSLAAAEVISHYGPRPQVSLKDLAASKGL